MNSKGKTKTRREFLKTSALAGSLFMIPGITGFSSKLDELGKKASMADVDLASLGLLDVTQTPYNADPTGSTVCTAALQQAIIDARDQRKVCFFPSGRYLIDNTLSCEVPVFKLPFEGMNGKLEDECGRYQDGDGKTQHYWATGKDKIVLLGSTKGPRPVIVLQSGASGFTSSASPKPAIKIWAQTRDDRGGAVNPLDPCLHATPNWGVEQPNINFNNAFKGIDIDLGGNAGAIGLRFSGSQGCYLMDSKVIATGAYAGFNNCPGQGGGTYNLEVQDGEYGIKIENTYRFPLLAGCVFKGQTKACIASFYTDLPTVIAGCSFEPASGGAIDLSLVQNVFGGISLVDCVAQINQTVPFIKTKATGENISLENCFVKGFNKLNTSDTIPLDPSKWIHISEYSFCKGTSKNLINGVISGGTRFNWNESDAPVFTSLHSKHWQMLPSFEDDDVVNVLTYGADKTGVADSTPAFKAALAAGNKVFVPKGTYKVSETLVLGANQHLFGLPKVYTNIDCAITTVDDPEAMSSVSFITADSYSWKAGKGLFMFADGTFSFAGNGGGRFYGLGRQKTLGGNTAPVSIYSYNVERVTTNPMCEIKNANDIRIYYFKVEAGTSSSGTGADWNTPIKISSSQNIRIYGVAGVAKTKEERPLVDVVDSMNIMVSLVKSLDTSASSAPTIRETIGSGIVEIPRNNVACLYLRDAPVTGLSETEINSATAFPNPVSGPFTIDVPSEVKTLEIYNLRGIKIASENFDKQGEIIVNYLTNEPDGVYFAKLSGPRYNQLIKIMKK